jgi:hypothetical protein
VAELNKHIKSKNTEKTEAMKVKSSLSLNKKAA